MFTKLIGISAGLILNLAGVAAAEDGTATKFTVRIENITKPDSFTASNGEKWSLAFSPGVAVVHTEKAPIFSAAKRIVVKGSRRSPRTAIQVSWPLRCRASRE